LISANAALTGSYDYGEVARSVLIAIAASYAALDLAGRVTAAHGRARSLWLAGGAVAMGIGIWAMQFKGMLAFRLPVAVEYHWPTVLASLLLTILASAVALYVVSRQKMGLVEALTGSVIMGGGIAGMHYIGIAAMRLPAITRFSPLLVAVSVVLAIFFSLIALLLAFDLREETRWAVRRRLGSAIVMGVAVSAMHYTGMAGARFVPASPPDLSHAVSISLLFNNGIAVATLIVLFAAIVTSSVDRRASEEIRRLNQELEGRVAERTRQLEAVNQALRKEIVERELAEKAVLEGEDRLRLMIDTIPAMIHSARPDGYLDFFNKRWLEYLGVSSDELLGWQWTHVIHPDDLAQLGDKWQTSLATGRPFEAEVRLRRADGEYRLTLHRKVPLRDEAGHIVKWYGSVIDIEERKRAEDELRKQKEVFQKIFENIPVTIAFFDADGQIELVNPEWERTLGWTLKEIREQNLDIFVELYPDPQYRQMARDYAAAATNEHTEFKVRARDGRIRDMAADVIHFSDGSRIGIGQDITERKSAEAALQEAQANLAHVTRTLTMGELVGSIAHEVNQPLTGVVANGNFALRELASGTPNQEKLREAIAEIVEDGTRASAVISRIRTLLKKGAPNRVELDINDVIGEVAILVRNEAARDRVQVQLNLAAGLPCILGDRVQLQQVLINLIMNGIEAMRTVTDRPRKLNIKSVKHADGVLVQVQDSGIGFDSDLVDRIFEPFFTTKAQGIGMGLSISRSIVESHGGRLWAESGPNGALFQFILSVPIGNGVS
jgi:PAS domain S-box-containing protein